MKREGIDSGTGVPRVHASCMHGPAVSLQSHNSLILQSVSGRSVPLREPFALFAFSRSPFIYTNTFAFTYACTAAAAGVRLRRNSLR